MDESLALLLLSELPHVGERTLARLQEIAGWKGQTLAEVAALPPAVLARQYGLPPPAVARLTEQGTLHGNHCSQILARLGEVGALVSQPGDPAYPRRFAERLEHPPPVLYLYGNRKALREPTLAILNSRILGEHIVSATVQVIRSAAREGFTLLTGGMKTTHRIAAVTTRAVGAQRAVVLDRGLMAAFGEWFDRDPFGFGPGRGRFDAERAAVLSPFRPRDHASPRSGRRRDELIAALADVLVVTSARPGGEIERICLRAVDRGQVVAVWHGVNAGLVAAGARPIDELDLQLGLRSTLEPFSTPAGR